jgi:predicted dehydrogenase
MEKIKVGIVGLGGIAQIVHIPLLFKMSDVEIKAVCDIDPSKARYIAKKYNIKKYYTELDKFLDENQDITAVIISTQTFTHKDLAIKCLEAGKNIMIEKPISRTFKEAQRIVEVARKKRKKVMVGMNNRFRNDMMLQRTFTKAKEIGEIFYVKAGWLKPQSSDQNWMLEKDKSGGGVFLDNGIVMLDLGLWILNFPEIKSVSAVNYYHNTKSVEDSSVAIVKFKNEAVLTIEVSWSILTQGELFYCNAFGKEGSALINPLRIFKNMDGKLFDITPKKIAVQANNYKKSFEYELKHFI